MRAALHRTVLLVALTATLPLGAQERPAGGAARRLVVRPVRAIAAHLFEGPFLEPAGVHFDARTREIFVCDRAGRRVAIADDRGVPTFSFGSSRSLLGPLRLAVDADGRILVADAGHPGIRVFDYDGQPLADLDLAAVPAGARPMRPVDVTVGPDGATWTLDGANRRLVRIGPAAGAAWVLEAPAARSDLLRAPVAFDLAPDGTIVIIDASALPVQLFDVSGAFLRGWGAHDIGITNFSLPAGAAVDAAGRIFVADTLRHDVKVFAADGAFLTNFGGYGREPGQLLYPVDVAVDGSSRVFVAERGNGRVQIFEVENPPLAQPASPDPR